MSLLAVVRKELRRKRVACLVAFCLANLLVLLVAALIPRTYTSFAELRFDVAAGDAGDAMHRARVHSQQSAVGKPYTVLIHGSGSNLRIDVPAPDAHAAFEALDGMLTSLARQEFLLLGKLRDEKIRLAQAALDESASRLQQLEKRLNASLQLSPEGGESGVGARIGQLLGQLDALTLQLRGDEEKVGRMRRRMQEIDARVAALPGTAPDAEASADVASERVQLQGERQILDLNLRQTTEESAIRRRRAAELRVLLDQARAQAVELQKDNQQLSGLRRDYDTAVVLNRQLNAKLQQLRLDAATPPTGNQLPYEVIQAPRVPNVVDGMPLWLYSAGAVLAGLLVTALPLLSGVLLDDRVRMADALVAAAEVPVLAVIPAYEPLRSVADVRWRVISALLLLAVVVAAHAAFLATGYGAA